MTGSKSGCYGIPGDMIKEAMRSRARTGPFITVSMYGRKSPAELMDTVSKEETIERINALYAPFKPQLALNTLFERIPSSHSVSCEY